MKRIRAVAFAASVLVGGNAIAGDAGADLHQKGASGGGDNTELSQSNQAQTSGSSASAEADMQSKKDTLKDLFRQILKADMMAQERDMHEKMSKKFEAAQEGGKSLSPRNAALLKGSLNKIAEINQTEKDMKASGFNYDDAKAQVATLKKEISGTSVETSKSEQVENPHPVFSSAIPNSHKKISGTNAGEGSSLSSQSSGNRFSVGGGNKGFNYNVNSSASQARSAMVDEKADAVKADAADAKILQGYIDEYNSLKAKFVGETQTISAENKWISELKSEGKLEQAQKISDKQIDRYEANKEAGFDYAKTPDQLYDLESKFSDAMNKAIAKRNGLTLPDTEKDSTLVEKGNSLAPMQEVQSRLRSSGNDAAINRLRDDMSKSSKPPTSHVDKLNHQRQQSKASQPSFP